MKKIFALLLVCLCAFSMTACGNGDEMTLAEFAASMEPTLGAYYDNPDASLDLNFDYIPIPDWFEFASPDECGIVFDRPYVFRIENNNHPYMFDYYVIYYHRDGSAEFYCNGVFMYKSMRNAYHYGKGMVFSIVTGDIINVKSENEIVFSKRGLDYVGELNESWPIVEDVPFCDDRYICTKDGVVCAYQFNKDYTVDYYENDVLIESFTYLGGEYAVGFRGDVHCLSRDKVALFVGEDIFTLGGIEYVIPPRGVKYTAEGSVDDPVDAYRSDSEEESVTDSAYNNVAYTLTDYVVVDNEICTFIIKSIDPNGDWGFVLNVFCENKTDKTLEFYWDNVSVMGFTVSPVSGMEVAAGKKANGFVQFSYHDLDQIGMQSLDDITFTLRITDDEFWSADDPILVEEYAIYPTGKSIQDISYPARKTTDNEVVLYDNDEYSAIVLSSETDGNDFLIHYYLENKTDHEIIFNMADVSVNGYMIDPRWGTSVAAGKKMYDTVSFEDYLLDEHGISAVEIIMFKLLVLHADSMDTHAADVFSYIP